jgi:protein-tyrosine-phosphatase
MNRFHLLTSAALLVLLAGAALAQRVATEKPKVVFVCEHGAAKSVLAAAEFEKIAKEKGLSFSVLARGTNIDSELAGTVVKGLRADGLAPTVDKPIRVEARDLTGAVKVISFGPDLSRLLPKGAQALDWSATPSPGMDYRAARDYIRKELARLVSQLDAEAQSK